MWTLIEEPGIYRGQCAALCGKDHGFMPIVVKAVSEEEYRQWVAEQTAKSGAAETASL
jgi:cytochrome c oxidase subunit 2